MDTNRVDLILQYALALASQLDEWKDRELGPIHFIKYVYLADLAFAKSKNESFTGIDWVFHHYGPWSNDLYQRLDGALDAIGANKKQIPSNYDDKDYYRWSIKRDDLVDELERKIPLSIYSELRNSVKKFGCDTPSLLHYVYQTRPMLSAAPGERLSLFAEQQTPLVQGTMEKEADPKGEQISNNEKKRRKERAKELKAQINQKIAERIKQKDLARQACRPEYDDDFVRGVEWLDSLAGQPIEETEGLVEIDPSMWKSEARSDQDVP